MTLEFATVLAAIIIALASIASTVMIKYDLLPIFKKTKLNLTGDWRGLSAYFPIDIYNVGSECVYEFSAQITQSGSKIKFRENINQFFDIDMNLVENHSARIIVGEGKFLSDKDLIIQFTELGSLTCGTMYLVVDTWGKELTGIIAVRNPYFGTPAGVKIILRRVGEKAITSDELGLPKIKAMADAFLKLH